MVSVELFSGAGGLALGLHLAGFHHLAVVEYNRNACDTLRLNRTRQAIAGMRWPIHEQDVRAFDYRPYEGQTIDLLAGGAPCQPFSLGGKHAGQADERNMFPEVLRAVRALRPRAIVLENVRGLVRTNFMPYFQYILDQLALPFIDPKPDEDWQAHHARIQQHMAARSANNNAERYHVAWRLYNTADFGVPQERHRVFMSRIGAMCLPTGAFPSPRIPKRRCFMINTLVARIGRRRDSLQNPHLLDI